MIRLIALLFALVFTAAPAQAQWQTPNHSIPVGRGVGTGFNAVGPCAAGLGPVWSGTGSDPTCGFSGSATRTLKDAATFTLSGSDCYSTILVDTNGSVNQPSITATLPAISSIAASYPGCWIRFVKTTFTIHPGKMVITPPVIVSTTGTNTAGTTALTLATGTGVNTGNGQLVVGVDTSSTYRPKVGIIPATTVASGGGTDNIVLSNQTVANVANDGTTAIDFFNDRIDGGGPRGFEIPGQSITVVSDNVSNWNVVPQQMSELGSALTGHHTVGNGYSVANPWPADASTANTQLWEFTPETAGTGTGSDIKINLPHPSLLIHGYTPATFCLMRSDAYVNYHPFFYSPWASWDQASTSSYPNTLEDFGDFECLYTDGSEYRTMSRYDAHQSGVREVVLSCSNTLPQVINCTSSSASIYLLPRDGNAGDHLSVPSTTGTANHVWRVKRTHGVLSHLLSSSTYGYAASANATHNVYAWTAPDGSLQIILGAANAGSGEYTQLDGANVNSSTLPGGVSAKSAELEGQVVTDGSALAVQVFDTRIAPTYFGTGYPASGLSAARIGINNVPAVAGNPTVRLYSAYPDAFSSLEFGVSGAAHSVLQADAAQILLNTYGAVPINLGTNNSVRWTIGTSGGLYSQGATGGDPGLGIINLGTGLRINGAAASGNYLRGNGTNFVPSAIQASDLPGSFAGFANPTATICNTAVNGSAATSLRSDGAPGISTSCQMQTSSLGLGIAAPSTAGLYSAVLGANNVTGVTIKRNTDTSPSGNFINLQNAAGTTLYKVDITGAITGQSSTLGANGEFLASGDGTNFTLKNTKNTGAIYLDPMNSTLGGTPFIFASDGGTNPVMTVAGTGASSTATMALQQNGGVSSFNFVVTPSGTIAKQVTNQPLQFGANNQITFTLLTAGNVQFNNAASFSANGAVATSLGSVGPTGSHTTVQTWLTIVDSSGTTRYIPAF